MSPLRTLQLATLSVLGGILLGALAGATFLPPGGVLIGAAFGIVIGFISMVIVAPALVHKRLRTAALPVYLPAAIVALASGPFGPDIAIPVTGAALAAGALLVHCAMRDAFPPPPHPHCRWCGHDVSADASRRCAACGARITPGKTRHWSRRVVVWLSTVSLLLLWLGFLAAEPRIERATLGFGTADPHQLMHYMGDEEAQVRRQAARRLVDVDPRLLREALLHPSARTRREAARTLGDGFAGEAWAAQALVEALGDRSPFVRAEAAAALGAMGARDALPALRDVAASDPSPMVARTAEQAIGRLEGDRR